MSNNVPHPSPGLDISADHDEGGAVASLPGGRHFDLSAEAVRLLRLVDGRRDLEEISRLLAASGGVSATPGQIEELIRSRFVPLGLIHFGEPPPSRDRPRSRMWLRIPILGPAYVAGIASPLAVLFRRGVVPWVLAAAIPLNLWLLVSWGRSGWEGVASLATLGPAALLLYFASNLFHELGHAAALRYRGEEPGAVGLGMYFLFPVFFSDVSAAWRLPPRRRAPVDLGGIYFHLLFCGLLAVGVLATGSATLLWTGILVNLSIVSNLNPFLRFDAYWLMADLAGIRDPRRSSLALLRSILSRKREARSVGRWVKIYTVASVLYFLGLAVHVGWRVVPGAWGDVVGQVSRFREGIAGTLGGSAGPSIAGAVAGILILVGALVFAAVGLRSLIQLSRAGTEAGRD